MTDAGQLSAVPFLVRAKAWLQSRTGRSGSLQPVNVSGRRFQKQRLQQKAVIRSAPVFHGGQQFYSAREVEEIILKTELNQTFTHKVLLSPPEGLQDTIPITPELRSHLSTLFYLKYLEYLGAESTPRNLAALRERVPESECKFRVFTRAAGHQEDHVEISNAAAALQRNYKGSEKKRTDSELFTFGSGVLDDGQFKKAQRDMTSWRFGDLALQKQAEFELRNRGSKTPDAFSRRGTTGGTVSVLGRAHEQAKVAASRAMQDSLYMDWFETMHKVEPVKKVAPTIKKSNFSLAEHMAEAKQARRDKELRKEARAEESHRFGDLTDRYLTSMMPNSDLILEEKKESKVITTEDITQCTENFVQTFQWNDVRLGVSEQDVAFAKFEVQSRRNCTLAMRLCHLLQIVVIQEDYGAGTGKDSRSRQKNKRGKFGRGGKGGKGASRHGDRDGSKAAEQLMGLLEQHYGRGSVEEKEEEGQSRKTESVAYEGDRDVEIEVEEDDGSSSSSSSRSSRSSRANDVSTGTPTGRDQVDDQGHEQHDGQEEDEEEQRGRGGRQQQQPPAKQPAKQNQAKQQDAEASRTRVAKLFTKIESLFQEQENRLSTRMDVSYVLPVVVFFMRFIVQEVFALKYPRWVLTEDGQIMLLKCDTIVQGLFDPTQYHRVVVRGMESRLRSTRALRHVKGSIRAKRRLNDQLNTLSPMVATLFAQPGSVEARGFFRRTQVSSTGDKLSEIGRNDTGFIDNIKRHDFLPQKSRETLYKAITDRLTRESWYAEYFGQALAEVKAHATKLTQNEKGYYQFSRPEDLQQDKSELLRAPSAMSSVSGTTAGSHSRPVSREHSGKQPHGQQPRAGPSSRASSGAHGTPLPLRQKWRELQHIMLLKGPNATPTPSQPTPPGSRPSSRPGSSRGGSRPLSRVGPPELRPKSPAVLGKPDQFEPMSIGRTEFLAAEEKRKRDEAAAEDLTLPSSRSRAASLAHLGSKSAPPLDFGALHARLDPVPPRRSTANTGTGAATNRPPRAPAPPADTDGSSSVARGKAKSARGPRPGRRVTISEPQKQRVAPKSAGAHL